MNYAGYDFGFSPALRYPDTVEIRFYVGERSSFWPGDAACDWTKYYVLLTYTDVNGIRSSFNVGWVYIAHVTGWVHPVGTVIEPNQWWWNGAQFVRYPDIKIGDVYNGADGGNGTRCSTGAHSHLGVFSNHQWGAQYEWWGDGPDYYWDYHVHGPGVGNPPPAYSSPPNGQYSKSTPRDTLSSRQIIGFIGGGRRDPTMWDNPLFADH